MQWDGIISSTDGGILKRKSAKVENTTNHKDLFVFGYAAKIFRDDPKAIIIDQGKHLLEWNSEKIDRYDVRATLLDSSQLEAPPGGYGNRLDYLPPEELRAEQLAEEERYYALKHNEEEELMYQEEEIKRLLHEKNATYGQVGFDYNSELSNKSPEDLQNNDSTKVEEPEKPFIPPSNFNIPYSIRLPDTMNQHIIIEKTARFISGQGAQMEILIKAKQSNNPKFEFLNQSNRFNPYYKFLLESIKNRTYPEYQIFETEKNDNKSILSYNNSEEIVNNSNELNISETVVPKIIYKPSPNCAYTQLISKIKGVPLPEITSGIENRANNLMQEVNAAKSSPNKEYQKKSSTSNNVEIKKISSGLMLAQAYASDSEMESDNGEENCTDNTNEEMSVDFPIPPESIQTVIDKTATYVVKNGKQFEETLRQKGDERFLFLNKDNEFYSYYMYKVNSFSSSPSSQTKKKQITPVSFSIKPKEETNVQIKPALPQEGSDDEQQNKDNNQLDNTSKINNQSNQQNSAVTLPEHVKRAIQLVENQLVARSAKANNIQVLLSAGNTPSMNDENKIKPNIFQNFPDKTITSINTITSTQAMNQKSYIERQKELKLAEEKVKDRLAQIAREKLGLISKEKQLQLERKKKAIAFLNHLKDSKISSNVNKSKEKHLSKEESDNDSVHSIPISSYGGKNEIIKDTKLSSTTSQLTVSSCTSKIYQNNDIDVNSTSSIDSDNSRSVQNKVQNSFTYTRSRSRSRSRSRKRKKSKHERHHSKKKSKRKSKNREHSRTHSVSPSFDQYKHHKSTLSKKSKKHKRAKDQ